jgi:hypothetical protein
MVQLTYVTVIACCSSGGAGCLTEWVEPCRPRRNLFRQIGVNGNGATGLVGLRKGLGLAWPGRHGLDMKLGGAQK